MATTLSALRASVLLAAPGAARGKAYVPALLLGLLATCKLPQEPMPPATYLSFRVQPANTTAGAVIAPAVRIAARDADGKIAESFNDSVTIALGTNPGGGTLTGTFTVRAVQGLADFVDLRIDRAATGYRLVATAGDLAGATSGRFDITGGTATSLAFTVDPTTVTAGSGINPSVKVTARDALGNTADSYTGMITLSITPGSGAAGATLGGTTSMGAVAGVATFAGLSIDIAGNGFTLSATATGLTGTTSATFDVTPATASQLVYNVPPSSIVAGEPMTPAVVVHALDPQGNLATTYTGNVTLELTPGTGTPGANLLGTRTVAAIGGVATFPDISINRTGTGYTMLARASNRTPVTSQPFDVSASAPAQLVFSVQPATGPAGQTITPAVQVTVQDSMGNTVPTFTGNVTLVISANPGGGTLSGTTTVAAVGGVATFGDLSIDKAGTGYRFDAVTGGLLRTSNAFSITPATATQLIFTVHPTTAASGSSISPSPKATALDVFGNVATGFTGDVTIAIGANPGGGTLTGTTTVTASSGVATFSGLRIDAVGTGYTLRATASALSPATSDPFDIVPASANRLAFSVQPNSATAGSQITPVAVVVQDAQGNTVTSFTGNVTVDLTAGTGTPGANLIGTRTVAAVSGVATFNNLTVNRAGTGYTLSARSSGLTGTISAPFDMSAGAPAQLVFTVQPTTSVAGTIITPAVQVAAQDTLGNTVPTFTSNVTLSIGVNPGGGTLSGTRTVAAVAGVATFSNLSIDKAETGYRLDANGGGLFRQSNAFSINPGTATKLGFTVQPSTTTAGSNISPSIRVAGQDAFGNTATSFVGNITLSISTNPGGGTLSGTTTVGASGGVAVFSGMSIDKVGNGYRLRATSSGLTNATSDPFDIIPASASQLVFTVQPSTAPAGATITPAVRVTARDAQGNTATDYIGNVSLVITGGTGTPGASLNGTRTVGAVAGVATFSTLSIDRAGNGYTLTASASGVSGTVSAPFNITAGAAVELVFTVQPTTGLAGATITPPIQVTARDAQGNTATGFTSNVTLSIGVNPGGGTLSGTRTVAAVAGVATFSNLSIDKEGTGYRLDANGGGLFRQSNAFSINPGAATQLAFTVQPSTTTAGSNISPSIRVAAQDAFGNTSNFTGNVTLSISTNPSGGTLSGNTTVAASNGVAVFSGMSIDKAGNGYRLRATASGLTNATSDPFDIVAASGSRLTFTQQPSNTTAGATITPAVRVTALDAQGNVATTYVGNVTLVITGGTGTPGASLNGTRTVGAVAGVATFSNLNIDKAGTGYTLTASASGMTADVSAAFNITAGAATALGFSVAPSDAVAGVSLAPAVQVAAVDAFGNTATGYSGSVTVVIEPGTGTSGATLSGTTTRSTSSGVATFSNLSIDKRGAGYRLTATSGSLAPVTSSSFTISSAAAASLSFDVQPTTTTANTVISPAIEVSARDAFGNPADSFSGLVTITIDVNPGGGTLAGTTAVTAANGVATFSTLSIDQPGTGYRLRASATGVTSVQSNAFSIN